MRGTPRRAGAAVAVHARAFGWERALVATLRHASMPFGESLAAKPLAELRELGTRDRLSLVAQFAAHQALLQFAGIADGELDLAEWAVVQKRGSDVRLIRVAARACDPSHAPPVVALAHAFAEQIGAELDVLAQPWARADAIYAEAFARVSRDVAADLRWMRRAACGAIAAPGPEGLRAVWSAATPVAALAPSESGDSHRRTPDECIESLQRFAELDGAFRVVVLRGSSPLQRYSALGALAADRTLNEAAMAERILAATSKTRHVFVVANADAFDEGSRRVVELLSNAKHGTWILPAGDDVLPADRRFLIAPRLSARAALRVDVETFVDSAAFAAYLAHGEVPAIATPLPNLAEPARSYIGALALLGTSVPRALASAFLRDFEFRGALEELIVEGVTSVDGDAFVFASDAAREEAARLIPLSSRASICGVAAAHASSIRAALLWLDAGDTDAASRVLAETTFANAEETVAALRRVPPSILTPQLAIRYAHALIDCGRYREARELDTGDDLVLARAERRTGDYATALARLERIEPSFDALLLRAEVLRLLEREAEAKRVLEQCVASNDEERVRLDYERALHEIDVALPENHYLAVRLATYRALERGDFPSAATHARTSHERARNTTERIDASLDRLFAKFSAGEWDEARAIAVEALQEVEETQGDRAAGGILFTLAYLAADNAQWAHATQRIARLRHYYTSTRDAVRLAELQLLTGHLDFSRGRFADARRAAQSIYERRGHHDQIREAAALILDELDWMEGKRVITSATLGTTAGGLRSTGKAGNAELTRRRALIGQPPTGNGSTVPDALRAFRFAIATNDHETARTLAAQHDLVFDPAPAPAEVELRVLRAAATREYPFASDAIDPQWCYA
ncbi:MAG: hypothetical protein M3Q69_15305, partial [Acidobacteriota bacterium]|nr:hypothetical protein [Acidobacteriota bacterium]